MKRLGEIQRNLKVAKDRNNDFGKYKYRNAEDILEAVKPLLKDDECIVLNNDIVNSNDRLFLKSTAFFINGEANITANAFAELAVEKKGMDPSQITGSATSYANKYALGNLLGISDGVDADATNKHENNSGIAKTVVKFGENAGLTFGELNKDQARAEVANLKKSNSDFAKAAEKYLLDKFRGQ